mmetsp:Transcript_45933/g.122847  ORF Transcript_45933/g.122847 Transcript_45933/m.122847 type:complete len:302 (+) Transcript_45933:582-1487(+)
MAQHCASSSGRPRRGSRLRRKVPDSTSGSWGTDATRSRSTLSGTAAMSTPSMQMRPRSSSASRRMARKHELFPQPEAPMSPTDLPGSTSRQRPSRTSGSPGRYRNDASSNRTWPAPGQLASGSSASEPPAPGRPGRSRRAPPFPTTSGEWRGSAPCRTSCSAGIEPSRCDNLSTAVKSFSTSTDCRHVICAFDSSDMMLVSATAVRAGPTTLFRRRADTHATRNTAATICSMFRASHGINIHTCMKNAAFWSTSPQNCLYMSASEQCARTTGSPEMVSVTIVSIGERLVASIRMSSREEHT